MKNITTYSLLSLFLFSTILTNCKKDQTVPDPTASDINFTVLGDKDLEQTIYPSVILGLSSLISKSNTDFFDFKITNPLPNSNLKIKIEASNLNSETIFQTQLANKGTEYTFSPLIKWNYTNLLQLKQSGNVDITFVCLINDKEIDRKNLRFAYRSVNECVYGLIDSKGNYVDFKWMFAAFVNEDNPNIDILLKDVLKNKVVSAFTGYQSGEQEVLNQVSALWYYLQSKSVKYSSITASSNPSQKVFSQYVRFFNDVYNNTQANCADGTVFLASILKKIGINPLLVVIPGHMYLAFYTTQDKSKIQLLETTMVGGIDLSTIYEDTQYVYGLTSAYRAYLSDITYNNYLNRLTTLEVVKKEISYNNFLAAVKYNINDFNNNLSKFRDVNNSQYKLFDIAILRDLVQPIANKK
jgi:hypothetical protein